MPQEIPVDISSAPFFKHKRNFWYDPKMVALRRKFGREAYGNYWRIYEMMWDSHPTFCLNLEKEVVMAALMTELEFQDDDALKAFLDYCVKVELFYREEECLCSAEIRSNAMEVAMPTINGRKGPEAKVRKKLALQQGASTFGGIYPPSSPLAAINKQIKGIEAPGRGGAPGEPSAYILPSAIQSYKKTEHEEKLEQEYLKEIGKERPIS